MHDRHGVRTDVGAMQTSTLQLQTMGHHHSRHGKHMHAIYLFVHPAVHQSVCLSVSHLHSCRALLPPKLNCTREIWQKLTWWQTRGFEDANWMTGDSGICGGGGNWACMCGMPPHSQRMVSCTWGRFGASIYEKAIQATLLQMPRKSQRQGSIKKGYDCEKSSKNSGCH